MSRWEKQDEYNVMRALQKDIAWIWESYAWWRLDDVIGAGFRDERLASPFYGRLRTALRRAHEDWLCHSDHPEKN